MPTQLPQSGQSCHDHCQVQEWIMRCPCWFILLGTGSKSAMTALGLCSSAEDARDTLLSCTFIRGGWLCLMTWRTLNTGRGLRCQIRDRCPRQSLSWPLCACHQRSWAGDLWEIPSAFASGKDFYQLSEIEEGNSTRGKWSSGERKFSSLRLLADLKSKRAGSALAGSVCELILVHLTKVTFSVWMVSPWFVHTFQKSWIKS